MKWHRATALVCIAALAGTGLSPVVEASPIFSPAALERAMLDLYCQFPDQDKAACPSQPSPEPNPGNPDDPEDPGPAPTASVGLEARDKAMWALEIFDETAMLDTDGFNDVMTHLAADYRQHPEHRPAIELVLSSIGVEHSFDITRQSDPTADAVRERLRQELSDIRHRNPVITVMDDVLLAFAVAYSFEFGRGVLSGGRTLWESGGGGVGKLERFKAIVRMVVDSDQIAKDAVKKRKLLVFAAGLGLGLAQAAVQSFSTYKMDPRHLLEPVQADAVHAAGVRAAAMRDELRAMVAASPAELRAQGLAYRDRASELDAEATKIQNEMEHLYNVAAQNRPAMDPIAQDLSECRAKIAQLGLKLDAQPRTGAAPPRPLP